MNRMPPAMHVSDVISNQGGKTYRTVLIRSSYRDRNGRSQKKTIANISHSARAADRTDTELLQRHPTDASRGFVRDLQNPQARRSSGGHDRIRTAGLRLPGRQPAKR